MKTLWLIPKQLNVILLLFCFRHPRKCCWNFRFYFTNHMMNCVFFHTLEWCNEIFVLDNVLISIEFTKMTKTPQSDQVYSPKWHTTKWTNRDQQKVQNIAQITFSLPLFLSSVFHEHSRMTSHLCRIRYGNTTFNGGRIKALLANIINRLREIKANCTTEMYIFEMVKRALLLNLLQISLVDIYTSWRQKKNQEKKIWCEHLK